LRIALPLGFAKQRPGTGVITQFGVKGDFEITVRFEILKEPFAGMPAVNQTSLKLLVVPLEKPEPGVWFKSTQNRAAIAREAAGRGNPGGFSAALAKWNPDIPRDANGNEQFAKVETHTYKFVIARAKTGRLRLVRTGAELFFYRGEGDNDFVLLDTQPFGTKDLKDVRIVASTGVPKAVLDVRVSEFRIRADGLVKHATPALPPPAPIAQAESTSPWLIMLLALGVGAVVLVFALTAGVIFLRKKPAPHAPIAPEYVTLSCPRCAKKLKTRADSAGRKLKCPGCGETLHVPTTLEEPA
jgi:DNA-directed RNA polymerase subunit RPC12/RpoP